MHPQASNRADIVAAMRHDYQRRAAGDSHYSQSSHARYLGMPASSYSRILKGDTDRVLADAEWVRIAMKLGVALNESMRWTVVGTPTYEFITAQLAACQELSTTGLFCDDPHIGKTEAAKEYARTHANVIYLDCSKYKLRPQFIRALAREAGVDDKGRLPDVLEAFIATILTLDKPLVILDEAGDLSHPAYLEIKALYNATEHQCAWYQMGAEGLEQKIESGRVHRKVGYAEIFDRFGARVQSITADMGAGEKAKFRRHQAQLVLAGNLPKLTKTAAAEILTASELNLRRLRKEVLKVKNAA